MTYKKFKKKWLGKPIDWDKKWGAQCVDAYRMYCHEVLKLPQSPLVKGAKNIWDTYLKVHFTKIKNTKQGMPKQGDIVIWSIKKYGHVGICDKATLNTVTCFEQNWKELDGSGVMEIRQHHYKGILGWLTPNVYNTDDMTQDEKRALSVIKKFKEDSKPPHGNLEGAANAAVGAAGDLVTIRGLLKISENLLKSAEFSVKTLTGKLATESEKRLELAKQNQTANRRITKLTVELETEIGQKNQYRRWWEKAKENDYNNIGGVKLVIILLKRFKKTNVKKK